MRKLIALGVCGLSITLPAQDHLRTFTSPDGAFRFKHSDVLVDCMSEQTQANATTSSVPQVFTGRPVGSSVPDSCVSQGGICGDEQSEARTIACYAYPKSKFKEKPTFSAAAFFVAEVKEATTEKVCLAGSQYWNIERAESSKINGVTFKRFEISDHWTSGGQAGPVYRAFHDGKCYELGIQLANSSPGAYDPGTIKEFTQKDWNEVQGRLKQALNSFRFLK
jgi:hypothetical protein